MKLILTEKPSVANDIAAGLGESVKKENGYIICGDYCLTWAFGHMFRLDDRQYNQGAWSLDQLPILPSEFSYLAIDDKKGQIRTIHSLLKKADQLIVATDAGREGELIAREIIENSHLNQSQMFRLWTSEALTNEVVKKEMSKLQMLSKYDSLFFSAKARQESDWVVGINLTRLFSIKGNSKWTLGRVQTPTLNLIVQRDLSIKNFIAQEYYIIKGSFGINGVVFDAKLKTDALNKEDAFRIAEKLKIISKASVLDVNVEKKQQMPPLLYSLTNLQRAANKLYGLSAQNTLDIAQKLYEKHKCISYPRTDSTHLAESSMELAASKLSLFAPDLVGNVSVPGKRVFDNSKLTDHHAIIPLASYQGNDKQEADIYGLIKMSFMAAFMPAYIFESKTVLVEAGDYTFVTSGKTDIDLGWKSLYKDEQKSSEKDDDVVILPSLKARDILDIVNVDAIQQFTKPLPKFTEESLLGQMEKLSLGTPATRASIIEKLIAVAYLIRDKKNLISTDKGQELIGIVKDSQIISPELTGEWEMRLDNLYKENKGKPGYFAFMDSIKSFTSEEILKYKDLDVSCTNSATPKMLSFANKLAKERNDKSFDKKNNSFEYVQEYINGCLKEQQSVSVVNDFACTCGSSQINSTIQFVSCGCGKKIYKENYGKIFTTDELKKLFAGETIAVKGLVSIKTKSKYDANVFYNQESKKLELIFNNGKN